jgi:hypothetical protein
MSTYTIELHTRNGNAWVKTQCTRAQRDKIITALSDSFTRMIGLELDYETGVHETVIVNIRELDHISILSEDEDQQPEDRTEPDSETLE